jgi:hypothetical protein
LAIVAAITVGTAIAIATIATIAIIATIAGISVKVVAVVVVVLTKIFAAAAVLVVISVVVFTAAVPLFPTGGSPPSVWSNRRQHLELLPLHIVAVGTPVSKRVGGGVSLSSIPIVQPGITACQTALVLKLIVFKRQTSAGFLRSSTSTD